MTDTTQVHNYYIAAGMIVFVDEEAGHAQRVDTNALIIHDNQVFALKDVGRIQQALQMQFLQKMQQNPNRPQILDVIITNLIPLGQMTEEQFRAGTEEAQLMAQAEGAFDGRPEAEPAEPAAANGRDDPSDNGAEAGASEGLTS